MRFRRPPSICVPTRLVADPCLWLWYRRLEWREQGGGKPRRLAFHPIGIPFNRRRPLHWYLLVVQAWRDGKRP